MTVTSGCSRKDRISKSREQYLGNGMTSSTPFKAYVPLFTHPYSVNNSDPMGERQTRAGGI